MRNRVSSHRYRFIGRAAFVAALAATAAGCSESSRLGSPLFTGSTQNQREIISGAGGDTQPMPPAVAGSSVTRSDLPPPGGVAAGQAYGSGQSAYGAAPSSGSSDLPAGDYVWTPDGVKPRGGASSQTASYGQPSYGQPAMQAARPAAQSGSGVHVVTSGETLYGVARKYGVRPSEIVSANGLASESLRIGQRIQIPGAGGTSMASAPAAKPTVVASTNPSEGLLTVGGAPATLPVQPNGMPVATAQPQMQPPAQAQPPRVIAGVPAIPSIPVEKSTAATPASVSAAADAIEPPSANGTSFRWPVRGRIISGFGTKPNGEKNDGINLAVPEGTAVKAAEAGTVIYAGNELEGYGKLVLIRHADDWVSAYAHNSSVQVKKGDTIRRGQTIATAGMSGSVSSPQVHFELRKKAKPVNPLDYLAGA
jgi:murein DD-endopeptidase MepM/ murein hydrolase activator NlpD